MMGPDCGTAIVDGVPLGFANAVRRGRIGLAGASGTGLQQVSCLLDRLGEGVSQLIGVGGRDLDERVGGLMMLAAIDLLAKPGDRGDRSRLQASRGLRGARRPRGSVRVRQARGRELPRRRPCRWSAGPALAGRHAGGGRPDRRRPRARRSRGHDGSPRSGSRGEARARVGSFAGGQRHVRGLFSGGTLCQEAALILREIRGPHADAGHTPDRSRR